MMMALFGMVCTMGFAQKTTQSYTSTQARLLDVNASAYVKPLTVEMKVTSNERKQFSFHLSAKEVNGLDGQVENIRSYAVYRASTDPASPFCQAGCDVVVAATFNITSPDTNQGVDVTVVGFPAVYQNWATATDNDLRWIPYATTTGKLEQTAAVKK